MDTIKILALSRYETVKKVTDGKESTSSKLIEKNLPDVQHALSADNNDALATVIFNKPSLKEFGDALIVTESYFHDPKKAHAYLIKITDEKGVTRESPLTKDVVLAIVAEKRALYDAFFKPVATARVAEDTGE